MKIILCYKNIELGTLWYEFGVYTYNSNKAGEREFGQFLTSKSYDLYNSNGRTSKTLFQPFFEIVENIKQRKDILELLGVQQNKGDYEILCAYAKQNQDKFGYNLKVVK